MPQSMVEFVRSACDARPRNFQATQTLIGEGLRVEAAVRRAGAHRRRVHFSTYESAWLEFEETLAGGVEFTGSELCSLELTTDGHSTWIYDSTTGTALQRTGVQLAEPIPGLDTLAELGFLDTLLEDFLLRDLGTHELDGREVRRIAMRPKATYRSHLLSTHTIPVRDASIDFDTETMFPCVIAFTPAPGSPAATRLGTRATVRVTYTDVRVDSNPASLGISLPAGTHVFVESLQSTDSLPGAVPFACRLDSLSNSGWTPETSSVRVASDDERGRAFARLTYVKKNRVPAPDAARISLQFGNYVSRSMARRRTSIAESGTRLPGEPPALWVLDRRILWQETLPEIPADAAPVDAFFESDGVFWFLSAVGLSVEQVESLAGDLARAQSATAS